MTLSHWSRTAANPLAWSHCSCLFPYTSPQDAASQQGRAEASQTEMAGLKRDLAYAHDALKSRDAMIHKVKNQLADFATPRPGATPFDCTTCPEFSLV